MVLWIRSLDDIGPEEGGTGASVHYNVQLATIGMGDLAAGRNQFIVFSPGNLLENTDGVLRSPRGGGSEHPTSVLSGR